MRTSYVAALLATLLVAPAAAGAVAAALDPGFGSAGQVVTPVGSFAVATSIAVQRDGLLVGGQTASGSVLRPLLARYRADGALDRAFGHGGTVTLEDETGPAVVAVQRGGEIVVATGGRLLRFLPDATPDLSFGDGGSVSLPSFPLGAYARLLLQPDGRIVLAGTVPFTGLPRELLLLRFRPDGAPDTTFGRDGVVRMPADWTATAAALAPDGKILVAGSWRASGTASSVDRLPVELVAARFGRSGEPDPAFGRGGVVRHRLEPDEAVTTAAAVQRDGRVLVGGHGMRAGAPGRCCAAVWRLRGNGAVDLSFGDAGKAVTARSRDGSGASRVYGVQALAVDRGGRIVVTSHDVLDAGSRFGLARFTAAGRPDPRFGVDGALTTSVGESARPWALALQPDGKIVLAGTTGEGWLLGSAGPRAVALARYLVPPCVVPQLRTRTRQGAAVALRSSGCGLGRVTTAHSSVPRGRVISQQHRPLSTLPEDAPVAIVVSRGPRR